MSNNTKITTTSQFEFNSMDPKLFSNTIVISIRNSTDFDWNNFNIESNFVLKLIFDDIRNNQISFFEKILLKTNYLKLINLFYKYKKNKDSWTMIPFHFQHYLEIQKFIKKYPNYDIIVHCEFGRSRSVAISRLLAKQLHIEYENKRLGNDWILEIYEHYQKKYSKNHF